VTSRADVEKLRDTAIDRFGAIDVWVNNAGRGISRLVAEVTGEELDQMMTVNVKSALYGIQAVLPHFQARGAGQIVNVSSFLSRVPMASIRAAYSASKAALNSLTANLRMDLAATHPGIHVTLVMPGLVSTEFARNAVHGTPPIRPGAGGAPAQTAEEVVQIFGNQVDLVLDGGPRNAKPSTLVDVSGSRPRLLRRGAVDVEADLGDFDDEAKAEAD